jgi:site-specific DNA recombinase
LPTWIASGLATSVLLRPSSTTAVITSCLRRDELKARLERVERPRGMSAAQISELAKELGGLCTVLSDATAAEHAEVYASLDLRLDDDPHQRRVKATADLSRVAGRVRGGLGHLRHEL